MCGAPFGDFAVVAGEKHVGDGEAAEVGGLSVLRILEVIAVGKTFNLGGPFAAEYAGNEADNRVDNDEGG